MKIGLYTPYLDTFGGGERYMLAIAEILSKKGDVDILLDQHLEDMNPKKIIRVSQDRFNLDLSKVRLVKAPLGKGSNLIKRNIFLKKYDLLIYLTDGSIFYSTAKKSIIHIQSPLINPKINNIWNKVKLRSWDLIVYNSNFTKENAEKYWKLRSKVIYPPVDVKNIKPFKKEKIILSVGRFFGYLKDEQSSSSNKKHELLISEFKKLVDGKSLDDWSLYLAGSASEGDKEYIEHLKKLSEGYKIYLMPNLNFSELIKLYGDASIYWHALGYGEDNPTKLEHFGITTVEAMSAGCVPVVINKGGQKEIVKHWESGFLWNDTKELKELTLKLINDNKLLEKLSKGAINRLRNFSKEKFQNEILGLL